MNVEIARDEWYPFFDAFSGMHRGRLVTLEIHAGSEQEVRATEVPLEQITAEGTRDEARISIVLRPTSDNELSHVVEAPEHVWLKQEDDRPSAALEIQSAAGETTLLRFTGADLPEAAFDFMI